MDKTIIRLASAVIGLVLVGFGAWLTWGDHAEHSSLLIWAGLAAIAGGLGTFALPGAFGAKPPSPPSTHERRRRRDTPPTIPVLPFLLAAATLTATAPGCSPSQLAIQADVAAATGGVFSEADVVLLRARARDLDALEDAAREECGLDGCTEERGADLVRAHESRLRGWRTVLECREPLLQGYQAWVDAIELAHTAASTELGMQHVVAGAARAGLLWRGFRDCVSAASELLGEPLDLPDLPAFVYPYLESAAR